MICGIKQYKLRPGQLIIADQTVNIKHLGRDPFRIQKTHHRDINLLYVKETLFRCGDSIMIEILSEKDLKEIEIYLSYICYLYDVKKIIWRCTPIIQGYSTTSCCVGAFIIGGDINCDRFEEIK